MAKQSSKSIEKGDLPRMIDFLAEKLNTPRGVLYTLLAREFPKLDDKEHCPNCNEKMWSYWYKVDRLNALTLMAMGRELKKRIISGQSFNQANRFKMTSMDTLTDAMRHRSTILSKLGLVAKVKDEDGKHDDSQWLLTNRALAFLKGARVPRKVKVWRNSIEERTDETISIGEALMDDRYMYNPADFYEPETHKGDML